MLWVLIRSALPILHKNICCGYSLEAPRWGASNEYPQYIFWGASNEYPQYMFLWRNKKDISIARMKKAPYLLLWYVRHLILPYLFVNSLEIGYAKYNPSLT